MTQNQVTLRQAMFETRQGQPGRALQLWKALLERDVHNGPAHHICGLLNLKLKQFSDAEYHLRKAVESEPENWEYHKDLGAAIESRKGVDAGINHFRRSILDCRTNPDMYVILAGQLLSKGSVLAAFDACEAALRIDGNYVSAWLERSRALAHMGMLDSAGASLAMARYLAPDLVGSATPEWARPYSYLWSAPRPVPVLGASRIAVCMTGSCETLEYTWHNQRTNLFDRLGTADLYMTVTDDGHASWARKLKPNELQIHKARTLDTTPFQFAWRSSRWEDSLEETLQEWVQMKSVYHLMESSGKEYDAVIYLRTDSWFVRPFPDVERLDTAIVHVPHQDLRGGVNDRFAFGSFRDMESYLLRWDSVCQDPSLLAKSPQRCLMRHLVQAGALPVLDPRMEMRVAEVVGGRMILKALDWASVSTDFDAFTT
jgi:tetratricopeptide (TPR) repeat protein